MTVQITHTSNISNEEIPREDLVTIAVTRDGTTTVSHISDAEFQDLLEESDNISSVLLHDD